MVELGFISAHKGKTLSLLLSSITYNLEHKDMHFVYDIDLTHWFLFFGRLYIVLIIPFYRC